MARVLAIINILESDGLVIREQLTGESGCKEAFIKLKSKLV